MSTHMTLGKKLIATLALTGLVMTTMSASFAAIDAITAVSATKMTFDNKGGEKTTIKYTLAAPYLTTVYVESLVDSSKKVVLMDKFPESEGPHTLVWDGTNAQNAYFPYGKYKVAIGVHTSVNQSIEWEYLDLTLAQSTTQPDPEPELQAPQVTDFTVTPSSFTPSKSEKVNINFKVTADSSATVTAETKSGTVLTTLSGFNNASLKANTTYTTQWDGKNSSGQIVTPGDYNIKVHAKNAKGSDTETKPVTVLAEQQPQLCIDGPKVTGLIVKPADSFFPKKNEQVTIEFTVSKAANVHLTIKTSTGTVVRTFSQADGDVYAAGSKVSVVFDGKDKDTGGSYLPAGYYTVEAKAVSGNCTSTEVKMVDIEEDGTTPQPGNIIKNLQLDPPDVWDPTEEELKITFEIVKSNVTLVIEAKKGSKTILIDKKTNASADDYTLFWDGDDENGNPIEAGTWEIVVKADGEQASKSIKVQYDEPSLKDLLVTKDSFDNDLDEFTHVIFQTDEDALVDVFVYKGSKKIDTLWEDEDVKGDTWYAVKWDGFDDDDDEVSYSKDYKFIVVVKNEETEKETDKGEAKFSVEEDDKSGLNVTNDYTDPVIFDEDRDSALEFNFCLDDDDAEVTLTVYKGKSVTGTKVVEVLDDETKNEGCHTVTWDVTDNNDKELKEGVYSYKIVADDGGKDTEAGRFVIGDAEGKKKKTPKPKPKPGDDFTGNCGGFIDTAQLSGELCEAIEWAKKRGIFSGDSGGNTFRPFDAINRAEALKVTLVTFKVALLPANGSNFGFADVQPFEWYATYVRTGKFYGLVHGYLNQTQFKPHKLISRVEMLKFVFEASDALTVYEVPGHPTSQYSDVSGDNPAHDWFFDYAGESHKFGLYNTVGNNLNPGQLVQRGEVALLLYRMFKVGLID